MTCRFVAVFPVMSQQPPRIPEGYVLCDDGKVRLETHDLCGRGHPTVQVGTGPCPQCLRLTMRWYCRDRHCDGTVIADNHRCAQRDASSSSG